MSRWELGQLGRIASVATVLIAWAPTAFAQDGKVQTGSSAPAVSTADVAGTYARPVGGDLQIVRVNDRLVMRVQGLPEYALQPIDASSYGIGPPAIKGSIARFGPGSIIPDTIEMTLKMGDTTVIAPKRMTKPLEGEDAEYKDLIGSYRSVETHKEMTLDARLEVANVGGRVALLVSHQPAYPLVQISRDVLELGGLTPKGAFVLSIRREGGRVAGFSLKQPNGTFEYVASDAAEALTLAQLRQKVIEAIGGAAALKARRTLDESGGFEHQSGMRGIARSRWKAPLFVASDMTMTIPGQKTPIVSRSVSDARRGVMFEKGKPPKTMQPLELAWVLLDTPQEPLLWEKLYKSVTLLGQRRYNNMDCYAVAKTLAGGQVITEYYAISTFLSAGAEGPNMVDGKEVPQAVRKIDWRMVGGIKRSFTQIGTVAGYEFTLRLTSSLWDVAIPASVFAMRTAPAPTPARDKGPWNRR
jgi:hypothetical protein